MNFEKMGIETFCTLLGSESPVPGGGAAVALQGATAVALTMMVCNLTIGKKKYAESEELAVECRERCQELQNRFLKLMEADAEAFNIVARAYRLPKSTEEEKSIRSEAVQKGIIEAVKPPVKMMEAACELLEITDRLVGRSNPNVISDLGVAVITLRGVVESGWLNVLINIKAMNDEKTADEYRQKGEMLLNKVLELSGEINHKITSKIK